ncbi:MAG: response regulator [Desulfatiglandales bacterium]
MSAKDLLTGKRILIVDDEEDVLETLESLLSMCDVVCASTFDEAAALLESRFFDLALLDIMGVDGYKLLEIATRREITAVMVTAHALSPEDTVKSYKEGAAYYIPKDDMTKIATYLEDVLEDKEKGRNPWIRWLDRWVSFYDRRFGPDWKNKDKEFWENFADWD